MSKGSQTDGMVYHAGFPNAAEDNKFGSLNLDDLVVKHRASTFFWRLDSDIEEMQWVKGSVLVVDRAIDPSEGNLTVVYNDDFVIAKFHSSGFVRLDGSGFEIQPSLWGVITYAVQPQV